MFGIIAFIIGGAAGIGVAYSLLENRLSAQKESLQVQHQKAIEDLEKTHQFRLDKTVEDVRQQAIADTQDQAQTPSEETRAQVTRPAESGSEPSQAIEEVNQKLEDMKTLVAQESRIREVTLAQKEQYQTKAQEAVRSLDEEPEAPEDPPIPYGEISIPPSASGVANPSPPISRLELKVNPEQETPVHSSIPAPEIADPRQILRSLGAWPQLSALPQLLGFLRHPQPEIRSSVALSLGQLAASCPLTSEIDRMIPAVGQLSQDSNPQVRETAVRSLGQVKSPQVLPYVQRALSDADPNVQKAASLVLQELKPIDPDEMAESSKPRGLWETR